MPNIDLSILNQRQTPAFYADTLANRPAAGFVGRIFVSTDTFAFYRDNGTGWDLIGGPGTGTVTGTGANGQVTFWNGASTITGSNDLFWDATNGHLGVNTNAPGTALDVHHDQPTVAILNQTVATNDVRIGFQNNGVGLWRIGAFYNAGANDFGIYDAVAAIQPVTVKKTTGQVLIGTSTVGSGKLVVASATGDNGIQIVGATAPSLRIDNAESGPTKRAGFGISTATNNFIQGSADRDFCMFNGSTTASPILFGIYGTTNVQEAARISPARNFLVGTTTDGGQKLQVNGAARFDGTLATSAGNGIISGGGAYAINPSSTRGVIALAGSTDNFLTFASQGYIGVGSNYMQVLAQTGVALSLVSNANTVLQFNASTNTAAFNSSGNVLIGTTTDAGFKLSVNGTSKFNGPMGIDSASTASNLNLLNLLQPTFSAIAGPFISLGVANSTNNAGAIQFIYTSSGSNANFIRISMFGQVGIQVKGSGVINLENVPTSAAGLSTGDIYRLGTVLNIVP